MEKMKRIAAFLMVLVILGLVVWAFILGITGSEYFSAALFLCILVPVLFYGISLITKLLTAKGKELAYLIDGICPNSREKSLAMTKLEESVMWANASIARN